MTLQPVVRTPSASELWWSNGHGTLVDAPDRRWYPVYHAYEQDFHTLGRQTLIEPIEWTPDGWFRTAGADPAAPIPKPVGPAGPHGLALSDDFSTNRMGVQWSFYKGTETDRERYRLREPHAHPEGEGRDAVRLLAAVVRQRRPRLRDRGRDRPRTRADGRVAGVLQQPAVRGAGRVGHEPGHAPLRNGAARANRRRSAGAPPPSPQRPSHRDDAVQRGRSDLVAVRPRMEVSGYHHNTMMYRRLAGRDRPRAVRAGDAPCDETSALPPRRGRARLRSRASSAASASPRRASRRASSARYEKGVDYIGDHRQPSAPPSPSTPPCARVSCVRTDQPPLGLGQVLASTPVAATSPARGGLVHLKTARTSYLERSRSPGCRRVVRGSRSRASEVRQGASFHVSAQVQTTPARTASPIRTWSACSTRRCGRCCRMTSDRC